MFGTIRKFNLERGYGFISTDNADFYFHVKSFNRPGAIGIDRKPVVGERVYFEVGPASMPGQKTEAYRVTPVISAGLRALAKGAEAAAGGAE
jgi:cold shock CspA family protein